MNARLQRLFVTLVAGGYERYTMCLTHQEIFEDKIRNSSMFSGYPHTQPECFKFDLLPFSRDAQKAYYLCCILEEKKE